MDLQDIVQSLRQQYDDRLLLGLSSDDDAAVYRLRDDLAIVQTADFITPIVDDPFEFGQISAANSLSDVYAKGGKPLTALNLCCFPSEGMPHEELRAILEGGLSKVSEAGAFLVGGHTVRDEELKYGLSVTGTIHPKDLKPNHGARVGDAIILTKPIGTGILTTAAKKDLIPSDQLRPAVESMKQLNASACEAMIRSNVHAATDITGFGLAVHLLKVARASNVRMEISFSHIPFFDGVRDLSGRGVKTGCTEPNAQFAGTQVSFDETISESDRRIVFDPQTSGGLAIFLPGNEETSFVRHLQEQGVAGVRIGTVSSGQPRLGFAA